MASGNLVTEGPPKCELLKTMAYVHLVGFDIRLEWHVCSLQVMVTNTQLKADV